jgi:hypothetical protein
MSSTIFSAVKRKRAPGLLRRFLRDLESGIFQTPKSYDVFSRSGCGRDVMDAREHCMQWDGASPPLSMPHGRMSPLAAPNFSPRRYRTEELKLDRSGEALRVTYPEGPLITAFCSKYPQVSPHMGPPCSMHPHLPT